MKCYQAGCQSEAEHEVQYVNHDFNEEVKGRYCSVHFIRFIREFPSWVTVTATLYLAS